MGLVISLGVRATLALGIIGLVGRFVLLSFLVLYYE